jgi:ATP-dependent RNA helicase SUPV3L1/SUV3
MRIPFDAAGNQKEKEEVAENIHIILKSRMQLFKRKCKYCGKTMPWNHEYNICEKCYRNSFWA